MLPVSKLLPAITVHKAFMFLFCKTENFMCKSNFYSKVYLAAVEVTTNNLMTNNSNNTTVNTLCNVP